MATAVAIIAALSGIALIVAEALQSAKSDGFSVITGMDSARFQPGTREYMLERIARTAAVIWILSVVVYAYLWYHSR
ncbi:MAG: preprotein translocase subunit SecG [Armatimonadetes bacterium]|nr:preprotein translocase subunit SecG [Armatimonadota bacterium]